jgi:hypothetical protein
MNLAPGEKSFAFLERGFLKTNYTKTIYHSDIYNSNIALKFFPKYPADNLP